jgi:uncharacterized protein
MAIVVGKVNQLIVKRKTVIGYMLMDGQDEVFLHNNESLHLPLKEQQKVDAFLYYDQKGRLAATLKQPLITIESPAFLKVNAIHPNLGVFVDMGIAKDLLLSKDYLPYNQSLWPIEDDEVLVHLKVKNKLVAKLANKEELKPIHERPLEIKETVEAIVHKIGREGIHLVTQTQQLIFVHHTMIKKEYRIGEKVEVKITFHSEQGYSGSLIAQKEDQMQIDAKLILKHLEQRKNMPLTANSNKEDIEKMFQMSKKAFKRALGHLYKQRKIVFNDNQTILVENHNKASEVSK